MPKSKIFEFDFFLFIVITLYLILSLIFILSLSLYFLSLPLHYTTNSSQKLTSQTDRLSPSLLSVVTRSQLSLSPCTKTPGLCSVLNSCSSHTRQGIEKSAPSSLMLIKEKHWNCPHGLFISF